MDMWDLLESRVGDRRGGSGLQIPVSDDARVKIELCISEFSVLAMGLSTL